MNAVESRETEALNKLTAKESEVLAKFETEQNDLKTYVEIAVEPKYDAFETAIATSEEKIQALTAQNTTADGNIAELTEQNELAAENIEALTNLNNTAASTVQTVTEKAAAAAASAETAVNAKTAAETAVNGFDAHVAEKRPKPKPLSLKPNRRRKPLLTRMPQPSSRKLTLLPPKLPRPRKKPNNTGTKRRK